MKILKNLDSDGKLFSIRSLDLKTIKELRRFANSRSINIPTTYKNVDEIRTYIKIQLQFINEGIMTGNNAGGRNNGRRISK